MVVTVVLSGLPQYVTLRDLAYNLDQVFDTDTIKSFHVRDLPNHPTTGKRRVALDFKSGYDGAMDAQSLLDGYKYTLDNGKEYTLKAKVTHDLTLQPCTDLEPYDQGAAMVRYQDERLLEMHLGRLKKRRAIVKTKRKLLKEQMKLLKEKKMFQHEVFSDKSAASSMVRRQHSHSSMYGDPTYGDITQRVPHSSSQSKHKLKYHTDSSDSNKKKHKHKHSKKKNKKRRSPSTSSSGSGVVASDSSDGRSRSPSPVKKRRSSPFDDSDSMAESRRPSGTALVPYAYRAPRSRSKSPPPPPRRPTRRHSSDSSSSSPRKSRPRSPPPSRRPLRSSRSSESPAPRRILREPSPVTPPVKRSRTTWSRYEVSRRRSPYKSSSSRHHRRSPSPSPSSSYRRRSPSPRPRYHESIYLHRQDVPSTSKTASVREVDDETVKDIDDLLASVRNEEKEETEEPTTKVNIHVNVIKKPIKEETRKEEKKKKKEMPLPIKIEPEESVPAKKKHRDHNINTDLIPKPKVEYDAYIKKEKREVSEDLEDGEIYEIESDEDETPDIKPRHYTSPERPHHRSPERPHYRSPERPIYPPLLTNNEWVPVTPPRNRDTPPEKPLEKRIAKNPRFVMPIAKLLSQMKKLYADLDQIPKYRLNAVLRDLLAARIKVMLKNESYKSTKEIVQMYRELYTIEDDRQFVEKTLIDINNGVYDVIIDDDDAAVVVKQEKEATGKENRKPKPPDTQVDTARAVSVSEEWNLFRPKKEEHDEDILVLEQEPPTLDLTEPDPDSKERYSDSSDETVVLEPKPEPFIPVVKQEETDAQRAETPVLDTGLQLKQEQGDYTIDNYIESTYPTETESPPPPQEVSQPTRVHVDPAARKASLIDEILKITEKPIQQQIIAPTKSTPVVEEGQSGEVEVSGDTNSPIKKELIESTDETLDDIANFVVTAKVTKTIDLTDE